MMEAQLCASDCNAAEGGRVGEGMHKAFVGQMGPRLILCQVIQKGFKMNVAWELGCPVKVHFDVE